MGTTKRTASEREKVDVTLAFDDGVEVTGSGVLITATQYLTTRTFAGSEERQGKTTQTVVMDEPLEVDRLSQTATMRLSNGDGWRVFPQDVRSLVRTSD